MIYVVELTDISAGETSENTNMLPSEIWLHMYFCGAIVFEMITMFYVNVVNTKVVGNFII